MEICTFRSPHWRLLVPEDRGVMENRVFRYPLFLPAQESPPYGEAVVVLNGLNESDYRKFFPWAATLAASGHPVLVFPIAFLMNRRPRGWFAPSALEEVVRARRAVADNDVTTPYNAVLSRRLHAHPERLFLAGLETYRDLLDLVRSIRRGAYRLPSLGGDGRVFDEEAHIHFLGYSLGGYLSLILLLLTRDTEEFSAMTATMFCSGSPMVPADGAVAHATNPVSPLILDRASAARLREFYAGGEPYPLKGTREARVFERVFVGADGTLGAEVKGLGRRVRVVAVADDRVIPCAGVEYHLGVVHRVIEAGAHEYPFTLSSVDEPSMERTIVRSYNVAPAYREPFKAFIEEVLEQLG